MSPQHVFLNGRVLPADEASISLLDIGLLRGHAVFELLRTVSGRPFLLAEHLKRPRHSAELLGLSGPAKHAREGRPVVGALLHARTGCLRYGAR